MCVLLRWPSPSPGLAAAAASRDKRDCATRGRHRPPCPAGSRRAGAASSGGDPRTRLPAKLWIHREPLKIGSAKMLLQVCKHSIHSLKVSIFYCNSYGLLSCSSLSLDEVNWCPKKTRNFSCELQRMFGSA